MAKKSSKASSPSWRTLMRRADAAANKGNLHKAVSLRKEAATLRKGERKTSTPRSEVMKKAWATRRANAKKLVVADTLTPRAEAQAVNAVRDDWNRVRSTTTATGAAEAANSTQPGRGEIVGGTEYNLAEEITKLARKKGGKDQIQYMIASEISIARYQGQREAEKLHMEQTKAIHEAQTDKIVCSAIGVLERGMKLNGGLPPTVTMSSYTICRMLDALNRAGYSAEGKK